MKKFFTKKALVNFGIFCLFATIALSAHTALAQIKDYTVLAPLPGTTECGTELLPDDNGNLECKTTLQRYLPGLFNLLIGLAAVFAVLMIVLGGIQYMSSDALQGKEDGKARIWNAVKGLVLVIGAWLILTTINPKLLEINLNIEPVTVSSPPASGSLERGGSSPAGVRMTQEQITASDAVRQSLLTEGIEVYRGPCTLGQTTSCVNLNGLGDQILDEITVLRRLVGEKIIITGGTEGGHSAGSSHYTGRALDLRFNSNLDAYIIRNGGTPTQTQWGPQYTVKIDGRNVIFLKEHDHWHMQSN